MPRRPARADSGVTGGLVALMAALVVAVVAGLAWRATNGRMRPVAAAARAATSSQDPVGSRSRSSAEPVSLAAAVPGTAIPGVTTPGPGTAASGRAAGQVTAADLGRPLGERATLLQFSSAFCAPCRATRVILTEVAGRAPGVAHVEIDAESHLDLVRVARRAAHADRVRAGRRRRHHGQGQRAAAQGRRHRRAGGHPAWRKSRRFLLTGPGDRLVTLSLPPHRVVYVPGIAMPAGAAAGLTKRRAVDFCRVATAICCGRALPPAGLQPET